MFDIVLKAETLRLYEGFEIQYRETVTGMTPEDAISALSDPRRITRGLHAVRHGVDLGGFSFPDNFPGDPKGPGLDDEIVWQAKLALAGLLSGEEDEDKAVRSSMFCVACGHSPGFCSCAPGENDIRVADPSMVVMAARISALERELDKTAPVGELSPGAPGGVLPLSDRGRVRAAMDLSPDHRDGFVYATPLAAALAAGRNPFLVRAMLPQGKPLLAGTRFALVAIDRDMPPITDGAFTMRNGIPGPVPGSHCVLAQIDNKEYVAANYDDGDDDLDGIARSFAREMAAVHGDRRGTVTAKPVLFADLVAGCLASIRP